MSAREASMGGEKLELEASARLSIKLILHFLWSGAAFTALCVSVGNSADGMNWKSAAMLLLSSFIFWRYYRAVHAPKPGELFWGLGEWEQSIFRQQKELELIGKIQAGEQVFCDFREAMVYNGRLVPKPDGEAIDWGAAKEAREGKTPAAES